MNLVLTSTKAAGSPSPAGWVQLHDFLPTEEEKQRLRGRLLAVIFVSSQNDEVSRFEEGREILTRLHEEYYGSQASSPYDALSLAVSKVASEFSRTEREISITSAAFVNGVLYSAVSGQAQAGVIREKSLAKILVGHQNETVSASGYPQENDLFLLATNEFFNSFSEEEIKSDLESLSPKIHSLSEGYKIGVISLCFSAEGAEKTIALEETPPPKKESLVGRFSVLISGFQVGLRKVVPEKKIVVKDQTRLYEEIKNNKKAFSIGLILIILLLTSIFFGVQQNKRKETLSRYEDQITKAEHDLDEALQLFSLDSQRARELFLESKQISLELSQLGVRDNRLTTLTDLLSEKEGEILAEYHLEAQMYLDLSLIVEGFSADSLATSGSRAVFLDSRKRKIIEVEIETKRAEALEGVEKIDQPLAIGIHSDRVFVLTDKGVVEVGESPKEVLTKDWQEVLFKIYSGNVYLLDRQNSLIYRFPGGGESFGSKQLWLAPGIKLDLSGVSDWTIDGSLWLAFASGKILKLNQGSPTNILLEDLNPPLNNISAMYSNEDLNGVYLLDKVNSRLIVIDKNGGFLAQYKAESLNSAGGLIVSEEKKQALFLLGGSKLYSIELKHLK